jgi:hypothetical protein
MELLDRYLQAVRFWLPKAQQQDIIAELSSDLHSQIDDRETELGRPLNNAELEVLLRRCGSPILVASRYRPQTQLIGPALFPIYEFVLKLVLLWILVPVFIVIVGPAMILSAANRWAAGLETWSTLWSALFVAAGVITLIFAILERTQAKLQLFEKWDLRSLPQAPKQQQPPSRTQTIFELIFGVLGLLWLLALPRYPFLILGPAAAFLQPAPMWRSFYLPMIALAVAGLVRQSVSLMRPQWTWLPPAAQLLTTVLGLVMVNFMINAATQTSSGAWHPYVVVSNSVAHAVQRSEQSPAQGSLQSSEQHLPQLNRVAAWVNISILLTLAVTWLGLCIAGLLQTWSLMRHFCKRASHARDPALLRML